MSSNITLPNVYFTGAGANQDVPAPTDRFACRNPNFKVWLVNPAVDLQKTVGYLKRAMTPVAPLGIAYISAYLKQHGYPSRVFDHFAHAISAGDLAAQMVAEGVKVVGFSVLTPNMPATEAVVRELRKYDTRPIIVFGNTHPAIYGEDLLAQGLADFVIFGEGEQTMLELCAALHRTDGLPLASISGLIWRDDGGRVVRNATRPQMSELDTMPFPDWSDLQLDLYNGPPAVLKRQVILPVLLSRGCPWKCSFCAQNVNYPRVRKRSMDNLLDEIQRNLEVYGISCFGFQDAIFPLHERDAMRFCDGLARRGLNKRVHWLTEARVDTVSRNSLQAMAESGLYLMMYGFESGNDGVLTRHNKQHTTDHSRAAMEWTREAGIFTYGLFMIGLPGETRQTIQDTIDFAVELDPEIAKFNRFTPYPGSPLFFGMKDELERRGFSPESMTPWAKPSRGEGLIYTPEGLTDAEMVELQRRALMRFYLRPGKMLQFARINLRQPANLLVALSTVRDLVFGGGSSGGMVAHSKGAAA